MIKFPVQLDIDYKTLQEMEDRLIELDAMQKVIGEGVGQLTSSSMKLLHCRSYS